MRGGPEGRLDYAAKAPWLKPAAVRFARPPPGTVTPEKPDGMDDPCESELGDNSDAENRALNLRICCGD
jgi:hypothetical protein